MKIVVACKISKTEKKCVWHNERLFNLDKQEAAENMYNIELQTILNILDKTNNPTTSLAIINSNDSGQQSMF